MALRENSLLEEVQATALAEVLVLLEDSSVFVVHKQAGLWWRMDQRLVAAVVAGTMFVRGLP